MLNLIADERGTELGYVIDFGVSVRHSMLSSEHFIHIADKKPHDRDITHQEIDTNLNNQLNKHQAVVDNVKMNYPGRERVLEWHEEFVSLYQTLIAELNLNGFKVTHKSRVTNAA